MTIVLTNDSGDIQNNIRVCTGKYLSQMISDPTLSSEVLDTLFERVELIPFRDLYGHYREAHECMKGIDEDDAPFLALALHVDGDGIWSNDAHLREQGLVRVWTTVEVLEEPGSREAFS